MSQHKSNMSNKRYFSKKALAIGIGLAFSSPFITVSAGGFQLSDHSVTSLGRSHAGYGVVGDDASSAHFNPAGMSLLNKAQFQLGGSYNIVEAEYTPDNTQSAPSNQGSGDDGSVDSLVPHLYVVVPLTERINYGFGITSPFGTRTDYDENFAGRFSGQETEIITVDINASFSYKVNDLLSLGAGISYQMFDATLSAAVTPLAPGSQLKIEGDSDEFGYNFGAIFDLGKGSRFGVGYRSEIKHDIEGDATFSGLSPSFVNGRFPATTEFTSPATAYFGYVRPVSDKLSFALSARWTEWSTFDELRVEFPTALAAQSTVIETEWSDSWTYTVGLDYSLNKEWVIRTGLAYDETPVPDSNRSVRTVDSDRIWFSLGASYNPSDNLQLDVAYRYIDFEEAPVNDTISTGPIVGSFDDINIHTLALQVNYKF